MVCLNIRPNVASVGLVLETNGVAATPCQIFSCVLTQKNLPGNPNPLGRQFFLSLYGYFWPECDIYEENNMF